MQSRCILFYNTERIPQYILMRKICLRSWMYYMHKRDVRNGFDDDIDADGPAATTSSAAIDEKPQHKQITPARHQNGFTNGSSSRSGQPQQQELHVATAAAGLENSAFVSDERTATTTKTSSADDRKL